MSSKGQSQHDQIFSGAKDFAHLYDDVIAELAASRATGHSRWMAFSKFVSRPQADRDPSHDGPDALGHRTRQGRRERPAQALLISLEAEDAAAVAEVSGPEGGGPGWSQVDWSAGEPEVRRLRHGSARPRGPGPEEGLHDRRQTPGYSDRPRHSAQIVD
jgi:hypothetical protein